MDKHTPNYESMGETPTAAFDALEDIAPEIAAEHRSVELKVGDIINDRFQVIHKLGFGGMGAVYKVQDQRMNEVRALKIMLPSLLQSAKAHERFLEEIKISQRLSNDRIVRVHDLTDDRDRGIQFFTMELVEGVTLGRKMGDAGGKLPLITVLRIMHQLCEGLEYAHQYTIHRDLKPQNIMIRPDGSVKILDFGLAKLMSPGRLNQSSMALGTAYYQAPEQSVHLSELDQRADIYSLGIILYQMLVGEVPVGRFKTPYEIDPSIPKHISDANMRCLETRAQDRYNTVTELDYALKTKTSVIPNIPVVVVAGITAAVVLIGIAVFWFTSDRGAAPNQGKSPTEFPDEGDSSEDLPLQDSASPPSDAAAVRAFEEAQEALEKVKAINGHVLMSDDYQLALNYYADGEKEINNRRFPLAIASFNEATNDFTYIVDEIEKMIAEEETNLAKAQTKMNAAKSRAVTANAETYALTLFNSARVEQLKADDILNRKTKTDAYDKVASLYEESADEAVFEAEQVEEARRLQQEADLAETQMEAEEARLALADAKKAMEAAKKKAIEVRASELAPSEMKRAEAEESRVEKARTDRSKTDKYNTATTRYNEATKVAKAETTMIASEEVKIAAEKSAEETARKSMQAAKANAQSKRAKVLAPTEFADAEVAESRVRSLKTPVIRAKQYDNAKDLYEKSANRAVEKEQENQAIMVAEIAAEQNAKKAMETAKTQATTKGAGEYARTEFNIAKIAENEINSLNTSVRRTNQYKIAKDLYDKSATVATKKVNAEKTAMAKANADEQQAKRGMETAKQSAINNKARDYASDEMATAVEAQSKAENTATQSERTRLYNIAKTLYEKVNTIAMANAPATGPTPADMLAAKNARNQQEKAAQLQLASTAMQMAETQKGKATGSSAVQRYASIELSNADSLMVQAEALMNKNNATKDDYTNAKQDFDQAASQYIDVIRTANARAAQAPKPIEVAANRELVEAADEARGKADKLRVRANKPQRKGTGTSGSAKKYSKADIEKGNAMWELAEKAYGKGDFRDAVTKYDDARKSFSKAMK